MNTRARFAASLIALTMITVAAPLPLLAEEAPTGMFDAVAEVDGPQGTRSMPVTIQVTRPMTPDQAKGLRNLLATGGQEVLANTIRGASRGNLLLGATTYPLSLVIAEPSDDGWKYVIVTVRNFKWNETENRELSLDFPFTVATFEVPEFGRGEGLLMPRAALSIGEDGRVSVRKYEDTSGRLKDIKKR